jgi:hypothetical protein
MSELVLVPVLDLCKSAHVFFTSAPGRELPCMLLMVGPTCVRLLLSDGSCGIPGTAIHAPGVCLRPGAHDGWGIGDQRERQRDLRDTCWLLFGVRRAHEISDKAHWSKRKPPRSVWSAVSIYTPHRRTTGEHTYACLFERRERHRKGTQERCKFARSAGQPKREGRPHCILVSRSSQIQPRTAPKEKLALGLI